MTIVKELPHIVELIAMNTARSGTPTRKQLRLAMEFDNDIIKYSKQFMRDILVVLAKFGRDVERATIEVLGEQKDISQDAMDAAIITESMDIAGIEADLAKVYEKNYTRILRATESRINASLDLGISIIDTTEVQILAAGGKRVGLLDLGPKMKRSVFRQLTEGRGEGESVAQLARRLRKFIPPGRFKKAQTRALLIARTETTHAQKMSAAVSYADGGVQEVMIMDSRKGSFDAQCDALNGRIVTLEAGVALMDAEHVNGTRRMVAMPPPIVDV